ncbi:hypothetical protein K504DRAFT_249530 [Pleomassaria siparia CBS 279.74]|uniref:Uncharacterized protein n=1 Tax=Pleomassaria siparia CBS 279.74 TaxID=1314801 RepID=A0A6G1KBU4_9PLEO|nr:hypothetical protein K504DRAFT_249530 [Pleomassaria siparia CBS 279.74]
MTKRSLNNHFVVWGGLTTCTQRKGSWISLLSPPFFAVLFFFLSHSYTPFIPLSGFDRLLLPWSASPDFAPNYPFGFTPHQSPVCGASSNTGCKRYAVYSHMVGLLTLPTLNSYHATPSPTCSRQRAAGSLTCSPTLNTLSMAMHRTKRMVPKVSLPLPSHPPCAPAQVVRRSASLHLFIGGGLGQR